ncbi:MAG: DUF1576 domain-containing protein [Lachnospirales bacterium]
MVFIKDKSKFREPYILHFVICATLISFAFLLQPANEILQGLLNIFHSSSVLMTDYTVVGGVAATLVNAGLCGIIVLSIFYFEDMKLNGSLMMSFWLVFGFSFFGKNILNILPILLGGYVYALNKQEPFARYSLVTILSTTLAPSITSVYHLFSDKGIAVALIVSMATGLVIGFIMPSIAANAMKIHSGFNLYNVGYAGGVVGIFMMGFFRVFDKSFPTNSLWGTENGPILTFIAISICLIFIIYGLKTTTNIKKNLKLILKSKGRLVTDYYMLYGNAAYINMGISGLLAIFVIYLIGADVNGATYAGIFTIFGFSALGKHIRNMTPVLIGAILVGGLTSLGLSSPAIVLGILFSTALSPIAGTFGYIYGFIAGAMHIVIVANLAPIHGGLNLYNNGLAAGFVATILIPIILNHRKEEVI